MIGILESQQLENTPPTPLRQWKWPILTWRATQDSAWIRSKL